MQTAKDRGKPVEVVVIEDQREIREGLAVLINSMEDYRCARTFECMEDALPALEAQPADLALVDIGLPGMSGIEGTRLLKARRPETLVLMLTIYKDDDRIFEAICAGASGYLLKTTTPSRLLESIREAVAGGAPMSPEVARRVIELFRVHHPPPEAEHRLSPQELHLLKLLGEGHYYKTAAAEMSLSVHTVIFHIKNIYRKLHVHSKSEAVAKALREGLIR
jgi:DNA-binding NarL/FixJ family response regulator